MTSKAAVPLDFDDAFTRALPADPNLERRPRQVLGAAYSYVDFEPAPDPRLIAAAPAVLELLGLDEQSAAGPAFLSLFSGSHTPPTARPYAMCYGGHQFGHWAGQLGDGRAIMLGEVRGAVGKRLAIQLKGSGPTPYSRRGDGYAVLRSSLREYVASEAMQALGVPTTRALSLVTSGRPVMRDELYDGHPRFEPGAVVTRVAPSFLRFGSFEIFAARGDAATLKTLVDYALTTLYPECGQPGSHAYAAMFHLICERTAHLIAAWQRVGFVHGVMNTDNMSIVGLTLDYGPFGFLESYDAEFTPNTTDAAHRRYAYARQPAIAHWNLRCLAAALSTVMPDREVLEAGLEHYEDTYERAMTLVWREKFGLTAAPNGVINEEEVGALASALVACLTQVELDFTVFFRILATIDCTTDAISDVERAAPLLHAAYVACAPDAAHWQPVITWLAQYRRVVFRCSISDDVRKTLMNSANPLYIPRNYLLQTAIERLVSGDPSYLHDLIRVLENPYVDQPDKSEFAAKRPEWARHKVGSSMLSCSS